MAISDRGFASMDKKKRSAIAGMGGRAAHAAGRAHEWDTETAVIAGRKGGMATARKARARKLATAKAN